MINCKSTCETLRPIQIRNTISRHNGKWIQVPVLVMHYNATEPGFENGLYFQHLRSLLPSNREIRDQEGTQSRKLKVFITIGSKPCDSCKLFMSTNVSSLGQVKVYIISNHAEYQTISVEMAKNILWAFTEDYVNDNSQYILEIDLNQIKRDQTDNQLKFLKFASKLCPEKSRVLGASLYLSELGEQEVGFLLKKASYIDHTYNHRLVWGNSIELEENPRQISLVAQQCEWRMFNWKGLQSRESSLVLLNISNSSVNIEFLSEIPQQIRKTLKSLNISYINASFNSIKSFFLEQNQGCELIEFRCRGIKVQGEILRSVRTLFEGVLKSPVLKNLKILDISQLEKIEEVHIWTISGVMVNLEELIVSDCKKIPSESHRLFYRSDSNLRKIKKIDYSKNTLSFEYLTGKEASMFTKSQLSLDFTGATFLSEENFLKFLKTQKQLKTLKIDHLLIIRRFRFILANCPSLENIYCTLTSSLSCKELQDIILQINSEHDKPLNLHFLQPWTNNVEKEHILSFHSKVFSPRIKVFFNKIQLLAEDPSGQQALNLQFFFQSINKIKETKLLYLSPSYQPKTELSHRDLCYSDDVNTLNLGGVTISAETLVEGSLQEYPEMNQITSLVKLDSNGLSIPSAKKLMQNLTSLKVNQDLQQKDLYNLTNVQANSVSFTLTSQTEKEFVESIKLQALKVNTLVFLFNVSSESALLENVFANTSSILKIAQLKTLQLSFQIENELTEAQLKSLFEIFKNKVFPQCESFKLEFIQAKAKKNIAESMILESEYIQTMIRNMVDCKRLELTLGDTNIVNAQTIIYPQNSFYESLNLKIKLDAFVFNFLTNQRNLEQLVLYDHPVTREWKWESAFNLPSKKITIKCSNRTIFEEQYKPFSIKDRKNKIKIEVER